MKRYFKSYYSPACVYSKNWYGTFDYAPTGTILYYDDNNCICIGYVNNLTDYNAILQYPSILGYNNEEEALTEISNLSTDIDGVYFGEKLTNRWVVSVDG